jgi:aminopeptidase-like protein
MPPPLSNGPALHGLAARLFRIPRSLAGPGVRETLAILAGYAPIERRELASGTPVADWEVPREWVLRTARLTAPDGRVIADAAVHNLHVLNYSAGFRGRVALAELRPHLFSLPGRPDAIPYRTSYWREAWGFCLPHRVVESLAEGDYEVEIDAEHVDGAMSWGEAFLPGDSRDEVLLATHVCHPQMANDNLSGLVVLTALAAELAARPRRRLSYRFLFAPGTIGAIAWLATNGERLAAIRHGLVTAGLGDAGAFHYKKTRGGGAAIDSIVPRALRRAGFEAVVEEFVPFGYDERQYNAPGYRLPVGALTRTPWGRYPEYHTSDDDLDFVRPEQLERSLAAFRAVVDELETREVWVNRAPFGEPRLGRHGLYRAIGGDDAGRERELALLWVLNLSDGDHDVERIVERSGLPAERIREAIGALAAAGLISRSGPASD